MKILITQSGPILWPITKLLEKTDSPYIQSHKRPEYNSEEEGGGSCLHVPVLGITYISSTAK
jgi:hypothetical protein